MRNGNTRKTALCGVLAALAVAVMFLGSSLSVATIASAVLASMVLIPVYAECGTGWGMLWFAAVAALAMLLTPQKETAFLFLFFGDYPVLRRYLSRIRPRVLQWGAKLLYVNAATAAAYGLMLYVFRLSELTAELADMKHWMLAASLVLANVCFVLYDRLLPRLEVLYAVRLRPKLKL